MNIISKQIAYNKEVRTEAPSYIVIHDTGNVGVGTDANAHFNYFNSDNRNASADFFVDSKCIIQANDYTKYFTWHCGDGKGVNGITNQNSIGVELCVNSDGDYEKAFSNLVELTKHLMTVLNIPIDRVVRHYDASGKICPYSMSKSNWEKWTEFKQRLMLTSDSTSYNSLDDVPEWAHDTISKLLDHEYILGDTTGNLDLSRDMLRILVILDRANVFDK